MGNLDPHSKVQPEATPKPWTQQTAYIQRRGRRILIATGMLTAALSLPIIGWFERGKGAYGPQVVSVSTLAESGPRACSVWSGVMTPAAKKSFESRSGSPYEDVFWALPSEAMNIVEIDVTEPAAVSQNDILDRLNDSQNIRDMVAKSLGVIAGGSSELTISQDSQVREPYVELSVLGDSNCPGQGHKLAAAA